MNFLEFGLIKTNDNIIWVVHAKQDDCLICRPKYYPYSNGEKIISKKKR